MIDITALEALKHQGDPLADAVVADLVASGRTGAVNRVPAHFRDNDQPIPDELRTRSGSGSSTGPAPARPRCTG